MATKIACELEVRDDESARVAGYQIAQTMNRLANNKGFSPAQWVLGENPSLQYRHLSEISIPIPRLFDKLFKDRPCGIDCDYRKLVRLRSTSQPAV
eukprot:6490441-Pyramimonas_sp.AAC.1